MAQRFVFRRRRNMCQVFVSRWVTAYFTSASVANRLPARCLLSDPKKKITGIHSVNSNCDVSRRYGWNVIDRSPHSTNLASSDSRNLQQTPIWSRWRSNLYHLLPVHHMHFEVRMKSKTSECLLLHILTLLCIYTHVSLTNSVKPQAYLQKIRQTLFGNNLSSHSNLLTSPNWQWIPILLNRPKTKFPTHRTYAFSTVILYWY